FGAPKPQEDHAVRACCAALAMQVAVQDLPDSEIMIRIGLHTGEVVARTEATDISAQYDVPGVAVHVASRLESMAQDGNILLSHAPWRAARHFVEVERLGPQPIRGLSVPVEVFRLTG